MKNKGMKIAIVIVIILVVLIGAIMLVKNYAEKQTNEPGSNSSEVIMALVA